MEDDSHQPATKADLAKFEARFDSTLEKLEGRFDTKLDTLRTELIGTMDTIKDQIIRAFQITEENIRQDSVHPDEHAALRNRVTRLEEHVGLPESSA